MYVIYVRALISYVKSLHRKNYHLAADYLYRFAGFPAPIPASPVLFEGKKVGSIPGNLRRHLALSVHIYYLFL